MLISCRSLAAMITATGFAGLLCAGQGQAASRSSVVRSVPNHHATHKPQSCTSTKLFVPEYAGNDVQVYCTSNLENITALTGLNTPDGSAVDEATNQVFVSQNGPGNVLTYNLATLAQTSGVSNGGSGTCGPHQMADDPTRGTVFLATCDFGGAFRPLDVMTDTLTSYLDFGFNNGSQPYGIAVDPSASKVFLDNYQGQVNVIGETVPFHVTATIDGLAACGLAVSSGLLLVSECVPSGQGDIRAYNEHTLKQVAELKGLDQNVTSLAVDATSGLLYASEYGSNGLGDVIIFKISTGQKVGTIGPFNTPQGISVG